MTATALLLERTIQLSGVAGIAVVALRIWRPFATPPATATRSLLRRAATHPWTWFVLVCLALLANQVLVGAYIQAVHQGDPRFITDYLGRGWFAIDRSDPLVAAVVSALSRDTVEQFLAPSILRVNAFLELPFALFAFLSVVALFDRAASRFLVRSGLASLASISFTIVFCAIELALRNPFTRSDLQLRAAACLFMILGFALLARLERDAPANLEARAARAGTLVAGLLGATAIAGLVLAMYDVTLMYNFAHLRRLWPAMALAAGFASVAFAAVTLLRARGAMTAAPWSVRSTTTAVIVVAALFLVPSLAIRYRLYASSAQQAGIALVVLGAAWAMGRCFLQARRAGEALQWSVGLALAVAAGGTAGATDLLGLVADLGSGFDEAVLLRKAALGLGCGFATWLAFDSTVFLARSRGGVTAAK